ncbi:MAG TPA: DJ-1/PfpI family protein [Thermoanaerobaculia bacterium]|nr:DJ-1/PfpI family protein [Thermoanaerobaculia bacterium]
MKRIFAVAFLLSVAFAAYAEHKPYTRNVAIVIYKRAEPLDWAGPFEVYNNAGGLGQLGGKAAFNVYTVSTKKEPVDLQGLHVVPNYTIDDAPKPDILVIPGGASQNLVDDAALFAWTTKAAREAEIAQSVCTGAFVLAKAGLLDNLEVTTHYASIDRLAKAYPRAKVIDGRRFIDNGNVVTTAGISAGIDGSLHLVARLLGRRVADQVARAMEYHWTPDAYLARSYQYLNPSADDRGHIEQTGDMQREERNFAAAAKSYRALVDIDQSDLESWFELGLCLRETDDHAGAADAFVRASGDARFKKDALVNAAIQFAAASDNNHALDYLGKALDAGFKDKDALLKEPALAKLRDDLRFKQLIGGV